MSLPRTCSSCDTSYRDTSNLMPGPENDDPTANDLYRMYAGLRQLRLEMSGASMPGDPFATAVHLPDTQTLFCPRTREYRAITLILSKEIRRLTNRSR
jgi:hypothetical protein